MTYFRKQVASKMRGCLLSNRHPALCLTFLLTGVHFRGNLQHVGDAGANIHVWTNQNS